ncbi:MAG: hypothetical protein EP338_04565 [Bacteroidetes bacterium]|nr:MAG: hypothetical protein EP338_04565 [Bacteroidota bacterium]
MRQHQKRKDRRLSNPPVSESSIQRKKEAEAGSKDQRQQLTQLKKIQHLANEKQGGGSAVYQLMQAGDGQQQQQQQQQQQAAVPAPQAQQQQQQAPAPVAPQAQQQQQAPAAVAAAQPQVPTRQDFINWLQHHGAGAIAGAPNVHFHPHNGDTLRCYWNDAARIHNHDYRLGVNIHHNGHLGSTWLVGVDGVAVNAQDNPASAGMQARMAALLLLHPAPVAAPAPNMGAARGRGRGRGNFGARGRGRGQMQQGRGRGFGNARGRGYIGGRGRGRGRGGGINGNWRQRD